MSSVGKTTYDVIIVGGGAMGCSIAYNLIKSDNNLDIVIKFGNKKISLNFNKEYPSHYELLYNALPQYRPSFY